MARGLEPMRQASQIIRKCGSQDARCLNLRSGGGRVVVPEVGCGSPVPVRPVFAVHPRGVATHSNNFTHVQVTPRPAPSPTRSLP